MPTEKSMTAARLVLHEIRPLLSTADQEVILAARFDQAVSEAVAEEREACAAILDGWKKHPSCTPGEPCEHMRMAEAVAHLIRARSGK